MAKKQKDLSQQLNNQYGGGRNYNGANDRKQNRFTAKRITTAGGATKVVAGVQQFGDRKQRYRDIRVALGLQGG